MSELINRHIITLLRRHDCVIMPGIGAFVATRVSAGFDSITGKFNPPARILSFNPAINYDDGLLASSVSRRMKISFEQARERVEEEAELIRRRLKAEGALTITRVGTLYRCSDSRLDFRPAASWTPMLPIVNCQAAQQNVSTFEIISPASDSEDKSIAVVRVPMRMRRMRAAAAAMIIFLLGFALSTPIDLNQAQNASLAAPTFTAPEPEVFEPLPTPAGLELNIASAPTDGVLTITKPEPVKPEPVVSQPVRPKNYVVVVASLASREQAQKFIYETGRSGLQIMQSGNHYRVYCASGATYEEALRAANSIVGFRSAFPDAWVCRR